MIRLLLLVEYFRFPHTEVEKVHSEVESLNARFLLARVNRMLVALKWAFPIDPDTGCAISGAKGGSGDGGFRLPDSKTGALHSNHRLAHAVDVYDPENKLDGMLTDDILKEYGLFREHPDSTPGWCHLQDVPPLSGKHTYVP